MSDADSGYYGPALPPTLAPKQQQSEETDSSYGPALPPSRPIPPRSGNSHSQTHRELDSDPDENEAETAKTSLPVVSGSNPSKSHSKPRIFGPALPSGFSQQQYHQQYEESDSSDEENVVGPLPPDQVTAASLALEERALEIKLAQIEANKHGDSPEQREEWMLKPPEIMAKIGIEKKTKFSHSKCERDRDQSAWTETPASKKRKAEDHKSKGIEKKNLQAYAERVSAKKRDDEQEHLANKLKKQHKRDKSLLELHREKKKKEKEIKPVDQQRRPFNRETDLQMNQLNSKQHDLRRRLERRASGVGHAKMQQDEQMCSSTSEDSESDSSNSTSSSCSSSEYSGKHSRRNSLSDDEHHNDSNDNDLKMDSDDIATNQPLGIEFNAEHNEIMCNGYANGPISSISAATLPSAIEEASASSTSPERNQNLVQQQSPAQQQLIDANSND